MATANIAATAVGGAVVPAATLPERLTGISPPVLIDGQLTYLPLGCRYQGKCQRRTNYHQPDSIAMLFSSFASTYLGYKSHLYFFGWILFWILLS